jgi:hypothetical protein
MSVYTRLMLSQEKCGNRSLYRNCCSQKGINKEVISYVFEVENIDIVIDEMDSLDMKVLLREKAKQQKLPVIMSADDGDDALIDIERYDLNPNMEIFGGLIPQNIIDKIKNGNLPRAEVGMLIGKYFVGPEHIPLRMYESLAEVGKSLPSWPQLGGAAALSGISLAFVVKKILLGEEVVQGRTLVSVTEKLAIPSELELNALKKYQKLFGGKVE